MVEKVAENRTAGGPPPLTDLQRAEASRKGVEFRRARRDYAEMIARGKLSPAEALSDRYRKHEAIGRMRVSSFLRAWPGIGAVKSENIVLSLGISPTRHLRGLGKLQVVALINHLEKFLWA